MMPNDLLADFTSVDSQRIWSASHDVAKSWDRSFLLALAPHADAISVATRDIELGGALPPKPATLDFASVWEAEIKLGSGAFR